MTAAPVAKPRAVNDQLNVLYAELSAEASAARLDGYGLYVFALTLRELRVDARLGATLVSGCVRLGGARVLVDVRGGALVRRRAPGVGLVHGPRWRWSVFDVVGSGPQIAGLRSNSACSCGGEAFRKLPGLLSKPSCFCGAKAFKKCLRSSLPQTLKC